MQGSLLTIDKQAKLVGEMNFMSWKNMIQPNLKACGSWPFVSGGVRRAYSCDKGKSPVESVNVAKKVYME